MDVELRQVKVYKGLSRETDAFTARLLVDGEYIADVSNDGNGGSPRIAHLFDNRELNTRPQVKAFMAWCETQPPHVSEYGELAMDADLYIADLLGDYLEQQQVKRWCKTKTVVKLKSDGDGEYQIYKRPYTQEFGDYIRAAEKDVVEILNERYLVKEVK